MNKKEKLVEIARSFSYKHNLGNYQSADFFCSQKAEVPLEEAEEVSEKLYHFCKSQVTKSLNEYLKTGIETPQSPYATPTKISLKESLKNEVDPNDEKEVGAEMGQDAKDEDGLDNGKKIINI